MTDSDPVDPNLAGIYAAIDTDIEAAVFRTGEKISDIDVFRSIALRAAARAVDILVVAIETTDQIPEDMAEERAIEVLRQEIRIAARQARPAAANQNTPEATERLRKRVADLEDALEKFCAAICDAHDLAVALLSVNEGKE